MDMSNRVVKSWVRRERAGRRVVKGEGVLETSVILSTIRIFLKKNVYDLYLVMTTGSGIALMGHFLSL